MFNGLRLGSRIVYVEHNYLFTPRSVLDEPPAQQGHLYVKTLRRCKQNVYTKIAVSHLMVEYRTR